VVRIASLNIQQNSRRKLTDPILAELTKGCTLIQLQESGNTPDQMPSHLFLTPTEDQSAYNEILHCKTNTLANFPHREMVCEVEDRTIKQPRRRLTHNVLWTHINVKGSAGVIVGNGYIANINQGREWRSGDEHVEKVWLALLEDTRSFLQQIPIILRMDPNAHTKIISDGGDIERLY